MRKTADRDRERLPTTRNVVNGSHTHVGRSQRQCQLWETQVGEKKLIDKPLNKNLGDNAMHRRDGHKTG
jgi:hypothetical protein